MLRIFAPTVGLLTIVVMATTASAETANEQFLDGLLQRRLFSLAEQHCQDQLANTNHSDRHRVEHAVDLSRTYAEWALNRSTAQRAPYWKKSHAVIGQLLTAEANNPFLVLARRQAALVYLAQGTSARYESESAGDPTALLKEAQRHLLIAVRSLNEVLADVTQQLDGGGRERRGQGLSTRQLAILQQSVRNQLADSLLNQALCFSEQSPDRINALQTAGQHLRDLSAETNPILWKSRVTFLRCLRELGQADELRKRAEQYVSDLAPPDIVASIRIELARQLMAEGRHDQALEQLGARAPRWPRVAAEWDFAELEILLAAATAENNAQVADQWRQRAVDQVEKIEQRHGPYWMRRAEGLMGQHVASTSGNENLDILVRAAQGLYRAGKFDESLDAYDRAHQQAADGDQADRAFQLGYTAAMIEHDRRHHRSASQRLSKLASGHPQHPRAAEAHLMASFNVAQHVRQQHSPDIQPYVDILEEHLQNWPQSPTANQARFWLGRIHQSQFRWRQAVEVLHNVERSSPQFATAVSVAAACYRQWFEQLSERLDPTLADLANEAADRLERIARQLLDQPDNDLAPTLRLAAAQSARLRMQYSVRGFETAERLLRDVLKNQDRATPEQLTSLRLLHVYALAAQPGRLKEAREVLQEVVGSSSDELLVLVDGLDEALATAAPAARTTLAELQLRCVEMLRDTRDQLSPDARLDLELAEAVALVASGRRDDALAAYRRLAAEHPANGEIQTSYAQLLLTGHDRESWQAALKKWREIEQRSRPKTQRWFLAKYSQARSHQRLGNSKQAARIIQLTQVLHPELGGPKMKARFLKLLADCQAAD